MGRALTAGLALWAVAATAVAVQRGSPAAPPPAAVVAPTALVAPAVCPECPACAPPRVAPTVVSSARDELERVERATGPCAFPPFPDEHAPTDPKEVEAAEQCKQGKLIDCRGAMMMARDRSPARSLQYEAQACRLGDWHACESVGFATIDGRGTPADRQRGLSLLREACDAGHCFYLGLAQRQDAPAEALEAYKVCCNQRKAICCDGVGDVYNDMHEPQSAAEFYRAACELGRKEGCVDLLELTEKGQLGPVTPEQLTALRKRACTVGDLRSCDKLKQ